jgi:hypothetical protein
MPTSQATIWPGQPGVGPPTRTEVAPEHEFMPGNGTYQMGGIDGKDWGVWQSDGAEAGCEWSINAVRRYEGGELLDSGQGAPGEHVRVDIEPDGGVGTLDGMIGDHRIVFMTNRCGPWRQGASGW